MASSQGEPKPFFSLPREIRDQIYEYKFVAELEDGSPNIGPSEPWDFCTAIKLDFVPKSRPSGTPATAIELWDSRKASRDLLLTCKRAHEEGILVLAKRFTFVGFDIDFGYVHNSEYFLERSNPTLLENIRHVLMPLDISRHKDEAFCQDPMFRKALPNLRSLTVLVRRAVIIERELYCGTGMQYVSEILRKFANTTHKLDISGHKDKYIRKLVEDVDLLVGQRKYPCEDKACNLEECPIEILDEDTGGISDKQARAEYRAQNSVYSFWHGDAYLNREKRKPCTWKTYRVIYFVRRLVPLQQIAHTTGTCPTQESHMSTFVERLHTPAEPAEYHGEEPLIRTTYGWLKYAVAGPSLPISIRCTQVRNLKSIVTRSLGWLPGWDKRGLRLGGWIACGQEELAER